MMYLRVYGGGPGAVNCQYFHFIIRYDFHGESLNRVARPSNSSSPVPSSTEMLWLCVSSFLDMFSMWLAGVYATDGLISTTASAEERFVSWQTNQF